MSANPTQGTDRLRLSVIIPTYNSASFVTEAIESVLRQSHPVDEIVVIDDGSTDDTAERLAPYVGRGVRFLQQQNQGVSATRNRGIRETHGDWVAFLDADDIWEADKIETQLACIERNPHVVLVGGNCTFWNVTTNTRHLMRQGCGRTDARREITVRNFIGNTSLVLVRRDVVEQLGGFREHLRFGEDWDMWIRMLEQGPVVIPDRSLILYRWHSGSNSHFREWRRYDVLSDISREAIERTEPAGARRRLHRRRRAYAHAGRAAFAIHRKLSRRLQLQHAIAALLVFPFDDTRQRLGVLLRALVGRRIYLRLRPGARQEMA